MWNKTEYRHFCHITQICREKALASHEVIVNLIAQTKTARGLKVKSKLEVSRYLNGIKVSDEEQGGTRVTCR